LASCEAPDYRSLDTHTTHHRRRQLPEASMAQASAEGELQPMSFGRRLLRECWNGGLLLVVLVAIWMLANEEFRVGGVLAGCAVLMLLCPNDRPTRIV
jgi:hypothetical protein